MYEELLDVCGNSDRISNVSDLSKLTYLEKCIKETLRIFPTVPMIARQTTEDVILSG